MQKLRQLKDGTERKHTMFRLPVDIISWIQEWGQQENKSQTRIVVEILEAEKKRRDQHL